MSFEPISHYESGHCEFSATLDAVAEVSALLKSFCQRQGIDETLWPQIDLAFCECLNNAVEHGCREDPKKIVKVDWRWEGTFLSIDVEDPGEYFDAPKGPDLPEDPMAESGRGCFIIDSIAESHTRQKTDYGQKVSILIRAHPPADVIGQMEDMYTMLQTLTHDLNMAFAERDIIAGFSEDMTSRPAIEAIIDKGIERLGGMIKITQANVWTHAPEGGLENVFHDGDALSIREAIIPSDRACACNTVIATEQEHLVEDCSLLDQTDPLYQDHGCAIVLPILYQRDCLGVFSLHSTEQEKELFFEKILPLMRIFAQFLGLAYTSAKTFRHREEQERSQMQLEIASEIQKSLLPAEYPKNKYCRSTGKCVAAMAVGGDYVDAIEIRDVGLLIVIADVMGKGVPAALLATIFRTAIRSRLNLAETPGWLLSKINKQIHEELGHLNMFITAQAAFLTYDKKVLKLASAGHCPALLLNPETRQTEPLQSEGMPLGIDPNDIYEERLIPMQEGSRVLFLTDGFYEAMNPKGDMLGIDRLAKAVPQFWERGLDDVPDRAFEFVNRFSKGLTAQDDQTLMALEIL
ncbi:SpoIIE family protein phosphatase [Pelagicoccus sp. SDUM812003]|uniref:SpoIIE family protein phosphatase n=1 Tax=Pelagicoccus sp. SDUM812003 TaxID=3041267 RepID=UPI00280FF1B4|nr:SpoIIE family protein phosphatase [Pelagicoccus sp. SDUM812003]MDQ8203431.1 SpoIIE family protein phosphatase [Pelagicoccus sp. SDUM812003]